VHSRCNLACTYCYVYQKADQTWRDKPRAMGRQTLIQAADRIGAHAAAHRLSRIEVVLHGGEPLLAGADFLGHSAALLRAAVPAETAVDLAVQTNGVLLDHGMLGVLDKHRIRVGVSVDGVGPAHDRHRRYPDGRPSYQDVERGLRLLTTPAYRHLFGGLLCAIDLEQDPVALYQELRRFDPPQLDFLLPHADWTTPPPGRADGLATPYADWLRTLFDRWYSARVREPGIRLFREIIHLLLGGRGGSELVGLSPAALLVIETDGAWEQVDTLKAAYSGATATGLNVAAHSVDATLRHPGIAARQIGVDALADDCRNCPVHSVCGGGFYGHRYRAGYGFRNRSVYCPDLFALIRHIQARVTADIRRLGKPS
jgi:uncharacterized protein